MSLSKSSRQLRTVLGIAGICFFLSAVTCAFASDYTAGSLKIAQPWTRATPPGAKVGGGYLAIENTGKDSDRLVAIEGDAAAPIEIHEMATEGGVMKMRAVPAGLEIKPGATVKLAPGGYHVMFMNLKEPFKQGGTVKATLVFEKAGKVPVEFRVDAIGSKGQEHSH